MKCWYNRFRSLYTKNNFIRTIGFWMISTNEERRLHSRCNKQNKCLKRIIKKEKSILNKVNESNIAIVSIIKNEGEYLPEWIEYHRIIGVNHFIIYDNDSTDDTYSILWPYIEKGIVIYHTISTPNSRIHHPQVEAYTDAVMKYRNKFEWMAFLDADEFITIEKCKNLQETINGIVESIDDDLIGGIGVHWLMYGSSGYEKKPRGLVIKNYTYRGNDDYAANRVVKTIANSHAVIRGGIHRPEFFDGYKLYNQNGNVIYGLEEDNVHGIIRINHYSCKSHEEFAERRKKGYGGSSSLRTNHDVNDIYDDIMLKYCEELEIRLKNKLC